MSSNIGRRRSLATRPFKLLLVGTVKVGKTSLLRRLVDNTFDEHHVATVGYSLRNLDIELPCDESSTDTHSREVRLQIWDTGGQERFKTITTSYYLNARAVVLCFDITALATFEHLDDWLLDVKRSAPQGVLLFLVATKVDLPIDEWQVDMDVAQSWATKNGMLFYALSSRTGGNVMETFTAIADNLLRAFTLSPTISLSLSAEGNQDLDPANQHRQSSGSSAPPRLADSSDLASLVAKSTSTGQTQPVNHADPVTSNPVEVVKRSLLAHALSTVFSVLGLKVNPKPSLQHSQSDPGTQGARAEAAGQSSWSEQGSLALTTDRDTVESGRGSSVFFAPSTLVAPSTSLVPPPLVSLEHVSIKGWPSQGLAQLLAKSAHEYREVVRRTSGGSLTSSTSPSSEALQNQHGKHTRLVADQVQNQHPIPGPVRQDSPPRAEAGSPLVQATHDLTAECPNKCGARLRPQEFGEHYVSCPNRIRLCRLGCGEHVLASNTPAHEKAHRLIPASQWGEREVIHWMVQLVGLENWNLDAIRANEIDGACLLQLSEEDLVDPLRLVSGIKRRRVIKAIESLKLEILATRSQAAVRHEYQSFLSATKDVPPSASAQTPKKPAEGRVMGRQVAGEEQLESATRPDEEPHNGSRSRSFSDESQRFKVWDQMMAVGTTEGEEGSTLNQLEHQTTTSDETENQQSGDSLTGYQDLMEVVQHMPRNESEVSLVNQGASEQAVELQDGRFVWVRCIDFPEIKLEKSSVVGSGSFGTVFVGHYHGATVAVKRLHAQQFDPAQLLREAAVMQSVSAHPHILHFFGVILAPPNAGFVSEALSCSLEEWLRRDKGNHEEPLNEIIRFATEAASGLLHLHCEKVVHRDVASRNLLLDSSRPRKVKICDFGMARVAETIGFGPDSSDGGGGSLNLVGPIRWMAPESLRPVRGHTKYSFKSDVYMFGITLWELLARDLPYSGVPTTEVGFRVMQDNLRPPRAPLQPEVRKSISLFLETHNQRFGHFDRSKGTVASLLVQLMERCWASNPRLRPSMKEVYESLNEMLSKT